MLYVLTHKEFDDSIVPHNGYRILWMSSRSVPKESYIRDGDYKDNIAEKNHHYSELSGWYWIWKNGQVAPDEVVGTVHYRSFFYSGLHKLSFARARKMLHRFDIILPVKQSFAPMNVEEQYGFYHFSSDLQKTREVLKRQCPEYLEAFEKVLHSHSMCIRNMMVTKKAVFDEYCAWLFPVLEEIEAITDFSEYDGTIQERLLGFLAERLMNTWILANRSRFRIGSLPASMENLSPLHNFCVCIKNSYKVMIRKEAWRNM